MSAKKVGRNDPCPCGSGKKYKQCCLSNEGNAPSGAQAGSVAGADLQLAIEHLAAGRLLEAETLFREILLAHPENPDALHYSGLIAHMQGNSSAAVDLIGKALTIAPEDAFAHCNLGNALRDASQHDEALVCYETALQYHPEFVEAFYNRGTTLADLGRLDEAVPCLERALQLRPDFAEAYCNLGDVQFTLGRCQEALDNFERALQLRPDETMYLYNRGNALRGLKRYEEALASFDRALQRKPDYVDALCSRANILRDLGRYEQALVAYDLALRYKPDFAVVLNNRGNALRDMNRIEEALASYQAALRSSPDYVDALVNLANSLSDLNRHDEAKAAYEKALQLNPSHPAAHWNASLCGLAAGNLVSGWAEYEWRWEADSEQKLLRSLNRFPYPEWDGGALEGKTFLIHAEQGLGDEILFASCIPDMLARAKHCVIECEPRLASLFARSFPNATVVGSPRVQVGWLLNVPPIDVQSAIGSLPRHVRPTLESFPTTESYLVADPQRVAYWRSRLALLGTGLKVGICWRSGLMTGYRHKYYSQLTQWGEIFKVAGVHFVNLQYDECADELREAEQKFGVGVTVFPELDLRNEIDESAALMKALDLVISAGTSVAEIAASLGVETWRVDNYIKPWTALGTDYMPWHPTERWFRQPVVGDWDTPLALVAKVLNRKALEAGQARRNTGFYSAGYGTS